MDPNECLKEILRLANQLLMTHQDDPPDEASELAEKVEALDEWLRKGGFLPQRWQEAQGGLVGRTQLLVEILKDLTMRESHGPHYTLRCLLVALPYLLLAVLEDKKIKPSAFSNEVWHGLFLLRQAFGNRGIWKYVKVSDLDVGSRG